MSRAVIAGYPHARAGHCGSGAFRDLLEFHGLSYFDQPLSEEIVFGLSGGLGFYFFELPELDPPIYLVGRTADLETGLCSHLGIQLDLRRTDDPSEGWNLLRTALDRGQPTMVWADIKHLDYLRVRMHNTMHDIVVTGYDAADGVAFIADNDRDEIETCSLESLARARNSSAFPGPNRHATWLMRFPRSLPPTTMAIERAIRATVSSMRGSGSPIGGQTDAAGLAGVREFAASYPQWPQRLGGDLAAALAGLSVFIVKAGTGGAMFRSLQARFLAEAAQLLQDERLYAAAALYEDLSAAWRSLAAAVDGSDPEAAHRAGLRYVEQIAALEDQGVRALEQWLAAP